MQTKNPMTVRSAVPLRAVLLGTVALWALPASAQQAESGPQTAAAELPPVVVQGATLEAKRPAPAKAAKPGATEDAVPAANAKKRAQSSQSGPEATAAPAGVPGIDVVTAPATTSATGDYTGGVPADRLGTSVSVVTGEELRARQVRDAADALRSLPGVSVSRGSGFAGLTEVRIRGAESNHTKVLIDGVEANDPTTGAFDFSNLSAEDIERIEVVRGPQSGIYGSNASGGVVNVVTRSGRGPLTAVVQGEAGSYRTSAGSLRLSGGNDAFWISALAATRRVDGFNVSPTGPEKDPMRINTLAFRGGARIVEGVTLDFNMRNVSKSAARDGFDGPDGGLATAFDDASTFVNSVWLGSANLTWVSLGGALTQQLRVSRSETKVRDVDTSFFFTSNNIGEALKYGYVVTYRHDTPSLAARHTVTAMIERESDTFTALSDFADGLPHERNQLSFAGEVRGEYFGRLFVTGNVRHDDNDAFKNFDTWRTSVSLKVPEAGLRPHASIGTGVRAPTMFEQFGFFGLFTPNPDLKPEETFGWDAGLEFTALGGRAILDVTYFKQDITDKIRTTVTKAVNLDGVSRHEGVEVSARWRLTPELTVGGAYTWLEARDADGQTEARKPEHAAKLDLDYAFAGGKGHINVAAIYTGSARDDAFRVLFHSFGFPALQAESVTLADYWLVNVAASYKVAPGIEVFGRVENLLDTAYREQFSYNTPGIAGYAGVKFTFEDPSTAAWAKYRE